MNLETVKELKELKGIERGLEVYPLGKDPQKLTKVASKGKTGSSKTIGELKAEPIRMKHYW